MTDNRIDKKFRELKKLNKKGFIAYITGGDPDPDSSQKIILSIADAGADIIEIGIPFSDPLADGPTIQDATVRALSAGMTVRKIIELVKKVRKETAVPIVLFSYLNPILKYGIEAFASDAKKAGADGVLILDLPPEESASYKTAMDKAGLKTIYLIAPTSTDERIRKIARFSNGFIYCVSRTGVTGSKTRSFDEISSLVKRVRTFSRLPVAVGFGVSDRSQVKSISKISDAVVIGSAIVKKIEENKNCPEKVISSYIKELIK